MPIEPDLLEILVCPETHQPLTLADEKTLAKVNARIEKGKQENHAGEAVEKRVEEGLVREDGKCLYVIDDGIPVMLIEESIELG